MAIFLVIIAVVMVEGSPWPEITAEGLSKTEANTELFVGCFS